MDPSAFTYFVAGSASSFQYPSNVAPSRVGCLMAEIVEDSPFSRHHALFSPSR